MLMHKLIFYPVTYFLNSLWSTWSSWYEHLIMKYMIVVIRAPHYEALDRRDTNISSLVKSLQNFLITKLFDKTWKNVYNIFQSNATETKTKCAHNKRILCIMSCYYRVILFKKYFQYSGEVLLKVKTGM